MTISNTIDLDIDIELTPRESELATGLVLGFSKKEIAAKKFISVRTVETTAKNIFEKVGVKSVPQLAVWWWCKNLNIRSLKNPLLSLFFLTLAVGNEVNADDSRALRASRVKVTRKGGRKDHDNDSPYNNEA